MQIPMDLQTRTSSAYMLREQSTLVQLPISTRSEGSLPYMPLEEENMCSRIYYTNTQKHSKGKSSLIDAGRNSVFSEVNGMSLVDKGRRASASIRLPETDMKSELMSIRYGRSKRLDLPPRPNRSKIGIKKEVDDATGINSRRKLRSRVVSVSKGHIVSYQRRLLSSGLYCQS